MEEKVAGLIEMQKKVHDEARDNILKAQERQKRQYDSKHNNKTKLKVTYLCLSWWGKSALCFATN